MKYLAFDTSGENLTVIVRKDEEVFSFFEEKCLTLHSSLLMPKVEEILNNAKISLKDLDFIACVVGAGSFTGIRIGISTAKALCYSFNLPALKITSFDCLAYNSDDGNCVAVIDAKHNHCYALKFSSFKPLGEATYISYDELKDFAGGLTCYYSGESPVGEKGDIYSGLIKACDKKFGEVSFDPEALTPLYVRKSQAEEGR